MRKTSSAGPMCKSSLKIIILFPVSIINKFILVFFHRFGKNAKPVDPPVDFLSSVKDVAYEKQWLFVGGSAVFSGIFGWIGIGPGGLLEGISIIIASIFIIIISAIADFFKDKKFTEL